VALIAAALENELLCTSLRRLYLEPLARTRDGGQTLRQTLTAFFELGGNISSVAALMGVSRRTISKRLERVDELTGRSHQSAELQLALRLHEHLQPPQGSQIDPSR
jgi:DNA-binding PucR family transcriptional regulator